ncbi:SusC/RagA family TonB-linked outer membrane protein [Sphingobacterium bambusae]|uniref:SusC/RagA family TonB-linked outer membrane protein n=1 Tax=Sphingobacterium bambusae TaxID=662858 RepID=A0ABW6B8A1_9SPHI|nr:SusC/RagA family TonB-linked outer membrane protein [Sphingobacterium bambusae]WPL49137.1 SusC/RagA family TonB-linked outer membrane protein [Sphingobacterium bambusae]
MKNSGIPLYSTCFVLLYFLLATTYAQVAPRPIVNASLEGTVIDARTKEPIEDVTIQLEAVTHSVKTDHEGRFQFVTGQKLPFKLILSHLNYEQTTLVASRSPIVIELNPIDKQLEEVVVTGVAQGVSRKKLSFALTKVDNESINTVPALDASTSLRGKVAGLRIDQSGGNAGASVYLRGAKSVSGDIEPLIVVDGFVTGLRLSDLNPNDIESIEVVKGAAASALYGTRGEGGIIQVLTKSGKGRGNIQISVDNELGYSSILLLPPTSDKHHFKVNPDGSFLLVDGARVIDYQENGFSVNLHPYKDAYDNTKNLLGPSSYYTNSFAVATSGEKSNIYLSGQNQNRGGVSPVVKADKRQNLLFNLGYKVSPKLSADLTAQYGYFNTPSSAVSSRSEGLLYSTLLVEPHINLAEKVADGKYVYLPQGSALSGQQWTNPFYRLSNAEYSYLTENLLLGGKLRYTISDHLNAEGALSLQTKNYNVEEYYPIGYQTITPDVELNNGNFGQQTLRSNTKNGQFQLNYNRTTGKVDWGLTAKYVYESSQATGFEASGRNLTGPVKSLHVTEPSTRQAGTSWEKTVNHGYFLNAKLAWADKFFVDALGRLDQSSRFGRDVGTAFFPRISAAYRLTEDIPLYPLTEFKVRVAYGQAGSLPPFGAKDSRVAISNSGGVSYTQNDNTDLKRAVTEETELGFDAILWSRLNVQFNYAFSNSTNDFISVPAFGPISGSANIYDNLGSVKSNSLELEVNGDVVSKQKFSWNTGLTFSKVRSTITSLGDVPEFTQNGYRKAVGASTSAIYGYSIHSDLGQLETNSEGFVTNAGNGTKRVEDYVVNEFGVLVEKAALGTANEAPVFYVNAATGNAKIIGEATPDFTVGFSNTFSYGPLSLYAVVDWQQGGEKFNETAQYLTYVYRSRFSDLSAEAGKPLNFTTQVFNASQVTDFWIEKTTYVALRELSLSYKLPTESLGLSKVLKNANLALIGRNLFILTNYQGVNVDGIGQDGFNYPSYRIISGKLTFNF